MKWHWQNPYWWQGRDRYIGIDIMVDAKGNPTYTYTNILVSQEKVALNDTQEGITVEDLLTLAQQKPTLPIILNVFGPFVIEKVQTEPDQPLAQWLGMNIQQERQFARQVVELPQGYMGAAARNDKLNQILQPLAPLTERMVSINLSPSILAYLPTLPETFTITVLGKHYEWTDQEISVRPAPHWEADDAKYIMADSLGVKSEELFLAGHALGMIGYSFSGASSLGEDQKQAIFEANKQIHWLQFAASSFGMMLILLLGTFWGLRMDVQDKQRSFQENQRMVDEVQTMRTKLDVQQQTFDELSQTTLDISAIGWYLDQIAHKRPATLQFTKAIYVDPLLQEDEDYPLLIEGDAKSAAALIDFTRAIETLSFVERVEVPRSEYLLGDQVYSFVIGINLSTE